MKFASPLAEPPSPISRLYVGIFAGFLCLFLLFQNSGYMDASDAVERYELLRALVDRGSLEISLPWAPALQPTRLSIGSVLAAVPFYIAGQAIYPAVGGSVHEEVFLLRSALFATVFYSALWMAMFAAAAYELRPSRRLALVAAIIAGTGTMVLPYSKSFQTENLTGLLLTSAVWCLLRYGKTLRPVLAGAAGLLLGLCLTVKPEMGATMPVFGLYLLLVRKEPFRSPKRWFEWMRAGALFSAGVVPGALIVLGYTYARYGVFFKTGYVGETGFNHPVISGLFLQTLSPGKGILWYSPILIPALYYLPRFIRRIPVASMLLCAPWVVMLCVYAAWHSPTGDAALGSRFMVSYVPLVLLPFLIWLDQLSRPRLGAVLAFYGASLALQLVFASSSFLIYYHEHILKAPDGPERIAVYHKLYYEPMLSPLYGHLKTFQQGLLDLHLLRLEPLEGGWYVSPIFWVLLLGAGAGFYYAWAAASPTARPDGAKSWAFSALRPAVMGGCFCALAIGRFADSGLDALKVTYWKDGRRYFQSVAHDINIPNLNLDRVSNMMLGGQEFSIEWKGQMKAPSAGRYSFRVSTIGEAFITWGGRQVALACTSGGDAHSLRVFEGEVSIQQGWHKLKIWHNPPPWNGKITVEWRRPGGKWESLKTAEITQSRSRADGK